MDVCRTRDGAHWAGSRASAARRFAIRRQRRDSAAASGARSPRGKFHGTSGKFPHLLRTSAETRCFRLCTSAVRLLHGRLKTSLRCIDKQANDGGDEVSRGNGSWRGNRASHRRPHCRTEGGRDVLEGRCADFPGQVPDCHEPGSIAPMSLMTYQEARPWARSIKQRVAARQMPPWHIDRSVGVQKFKNDMSLTDEQIETIVALGGSGRAAGQPRRHAAAQAGRPTTLYWQAERDGYGPPDIVVKSPEHTMPAVQPGSVVASAASTSRSSPSRAGCGWSRSGRPTCRAARSCTTRSRTRC